MDPMLMVTAAETAEEAKASGLQLWGAGLFGLVIGWFIYFLNRYRKEVVLGDLTTVLSAVGGAAVLALFPAGTDLFGAYGIGLALGFFGYFIVLAILVAMNSDFDSGYLIDGRRKNPPTGWDYREGGERTMGGPASGPRGA